MSEDATTPKSNIRAKRVSLFGHADAEQTLLESYQERPHSACLADRRRAPASARRRSLTAWRVSCSRIPIRDSGGAKRKNACRRCRQSGGAPRRRGSARRSAGAAAYDQRGDRQTLHRHPRRRCAAYVPFFGSTAGEGGWRVGIVDTVDELQYPQGANALLKVLEEPPPRALFLLLSNSPGRELPTIRSRCRRLLLRPLEADDVARAAAAAIGRDAGDR